MRTFAPWILAAVLIGLLLRQIPPAEIALALSEVNLPLFLSISMLGTAIWFLLESFAYAYFFSRLGVSLSWREARSIRGMTYLLAPIHWNLGKAAVVLRLNHVRGMPLIEGASAMFVYQLMSMTALALLATLGLAWLPSADPARDLTHSLPSVSPAVPLALAFTAAAVCLILHTDRPDFPALRRLRDLRLAHAFRRARPKHLAVVIAIKATYHLVFAIIFFLGLHAFGVDLPFLLVLIATPLIQLAGGLPITPAGLGTQQAAMIYFFAGRFGGNGTEAAVAAFGFSLPFLVMLLRAGIGLIYLRGLSSAPSETPPKTPKDEGSDKTSASSPETRSA